MLTMTSADDLERSARLRQRLGLSTWLPVRMECEDGLLSLLPGDHMYPDNPEYTGPSGDRSVKFYVISHLSIRLKKKVHTIKAVAQL